MSNEIMPLNVFHDFKTISYLKKLVFGMFLYIRGKNILTARFFKRLEKGKILFCVVMHVLVHVCM